MPGYDRVASALLPRLSQRVSTIALALSIASLGGCSSKSSEVPGLFVDAAAGSGGSIGDAAALDAASAPTSDAGATSGDPPLPSFTAASTCDPFGSIFSAGNTYFVMNNVFNDAATSQCFAVAGTGFTLTTANHNITPDGPPASYVAFVLGCHFGNCSANSGLPKLVSTITSAPTSFSVHTAGDIWDASYDVWFDHTTNTTSRNNGLEMMIWLDSTGVMPLGSQVDTATIAGASWQVWYGASASPPVISYRRATATASVSFDLELFIADAMARNASTGKPPANGSPALDAAWYMTSIQAGFELWKAGQGAAVPSFAAAVH